MRRRLSTRSLVVGPLAAMGAQSGYDWFSDSFTRSDGSLGGNWINSAWAVSGNAAVNNAAGTELITNGSFTEWVDGTPTGFAKYLNSPPDREVTEVAPNAGHGGGGTGAANIYSNIYGIGLRAAITPKTNVWLRAGLDVTNRVAGGVSPNIGTDYIYSATGSYWRTLGGGASYLYLVSSGSTDITIDNVSLKEIGLTDACALIRSVGEDIRISADVLYNGRGWQGGLAILDNPTAPNNGILVYVNVRAFDSQLIVDKLLSGTRSNLLTQTVSQPNLALAYTIICQKENGYYRVRWKNIPANVLSNFSTSEVTDAAVLDCHYVGLLSPHPSITFDNFSLCPSSAVHKTFFVGDSKMTYALGDVPGKFYTSRLFFDEVPARQAVGGHTMTQAKAAIDATLAAANETPELCFFNVGINNADSPPDESAFKADFQYILDAIHTKWPTTKIYIMNGVYKASNPPGCNTISGWLNDVLLLNSGYCYAWADERVWFAANMGLYSSDGVHYTNAGAAEAARLGRVAAGYE